jgi:hypothetical protein
MNDTVHVEVQVVEFFAIEVWASRINWDFLSIDFPGLFLDNRADNLGIWRLISTVRWNDLKDCLLAFLAQPAEKG